MEILVAILISTAAVTAVLYPVIRAQRARPAGAPGPATAPQEPGPHEGASAPAPAPSGGGGPEAEIRAYRAALRAGTACRRCGLANPPGSRFCAECGLALRRPEPAG